MEVLASFLIIVAFVAAFNPIKAAPDDELIICANVPGIKYSQKFEVKPALQFKEENIVKQEYDYSCGSAALATLLKYYLGENLTEQQVIQGLMEYGDSKMIEQRRAFSLLDMKRFVTILGYKGAGYNAELEDLRSLDTPGIVPIEFYGYKHFVVFRGIYADHIFFADPYLGNISFSISQFEKMWYQNIVFIVTDSGISTDALSLAEEDLLLIDFDMNKDALPADLPSSFITTRHNFIEAQGRYKFKNINVY